MDSITRVFAALLSGVLLTLGAGSGALAAVTVKGPQNVPDCSEYAYTTSDCKKPTWSVSDPVGTIAGGQGTPKAVIAWGQGANAVDVTADCGKQSGHRHVKVMKVTITDLRMTPGAFDDADHDLGPATARLAPPQQASQASPRGDRGLGFRDLHLRPDRGRARTLFQSRACRLDRGLPVALADGRLE